MEKTQNFFLIPFGEYSLEFKKIIKTMGFKFAFGQHSGVIDETKDFWELPRFPINEKYGEIKRFNTLMKTLPFKYKDIEPEDRYFYNQKILQKLKLKFYENIKNLKILIVFLMREINGETQKIFINDNELEIEIAEKFIGERGRINCSLKEIDGFWRWLGIQYVVSEK